MHDDKQIIRDKTKKKKKKSRSMNAGISRDKDIVCERMQCVEASLSLLSVTSGQHNSDMTFPQDV